MERVLRPQGLDVNGGRRRIVQQMVGVDRDEAGDRGEPEAAVGASPSRGLPAAVAFSLAHAIELAVGPAGDFSNPARRKIRKGSSGDLEDPLVAAAPEIGAVILKDGEDAAGEKALLLGVAGIAPIGIAVETLVVRADPDNPLPVPVKEGDAVVPEFRGDAFLVEAPPGEAAQSVAEGAKPKIIVGHLDHGCDFRVHSYPPVEPMVPPNALLEAAEMTGHPSPETTTAVFHKDAQGEIPQKRVG